MDYMELIKPKETKASFTDRAIAHSHEFYLSGPIESAEEYIEWFDKIRHASEHDYIKIYINSPGGDLFTAIQFMRVLAETQATVCCSVEGMCMSAATVIFLCGHSFEVTPHSMFMFHNYSGGAFGKGGEMIDQLQHERKWSESLLKEVYKDFLTDAEVTSMLDNKDLWMDGQEVINRLNSKVETLQKMVEEANKPVKTAAQNSKTTKKSPVAKKQQPIKE